MTSTSSFVCHGLQDRRNPSASAGLRVLSLATYPIINPRHGGQIRAAAMTRALSEAGFDIVHLAIYDINAHPDTPDDTWNIALSGGNLAEIARLGGRPDIDACFFAALDRRGLRKLISAIRNFGPHILLLQQPWLWPIAKLWLASHPDVVIIYSSHNHEGAMLREQQSWSADHDQGSLAARGGEIEHDLLMHSDGIIGVSRFDIDSLASPSPLQLVAPNGTDPRKKQLVDEEPKRSEDHSPYLFYIASAHPPNVEGFLSCVLPLLPFLEGKASIVVIGSICDALPTNLRNVMLMGFQHDNVVSEMISRCRGIILPIQSGGGTNLKTAEAIYSGRPIVSTSFAMRGFEAFAGLPHIRVAKDVATFVKLCLEVLDDDARVDGMQARPAELESLLWPQALSGVPSFLSKCFQTRMKKRSQLPCRVQLSRYELSLLIEEDHAAFDDLDGGIRLLPKRLTLALPKGFSRAAFKLLAWRALPTPMIVTLSSATRVLCFREVGGDVSQWVEFSLEGLSEPGSEVVRIHVDCAVANAKDTRDRDKDRRCGAFITDIRLDRG